MNLVENYLAEQGYNYFGNAAEDTLVFFVRDEGAPSGESSQGRSHETVTNLSGDAVNRAAGSLFAERAAVNSATYAGVYDENSDESINFDIDQNIEPADNNSKGNDISDTIPQIAPVSNKQTEALSSRFKN